MSPTWSALTLLLLGTVLLVVTLMAVARRNGGAAFAGGGTAAKIQGTLLVNLLGANLGLSGVVLFAMITVLTDAVSAAWCRSHGLLIYFFAILSAIYLAGLAFLQWSALVLDSGSLVLFRFSTRFPPLAIGTSVLFTIVVALAGSFEQQTLFCFVYHPPGIFIAFFAVPVCALTGAAAFFSAHCGFRILRSKSFSLRKFVLAFREYTRVPENDASIGNDNDVFVAGQSEAVQSGANDHGVRGEEEHGSSLSVSKTATIILVRTKLVFAVLIASVGAFCAIIVELRQGISHDHYYQGKSMSVDEARSIHESEIGYAVFYLAALQIFLFASIATDPSLWIVYNVYS